MTNLVLPLRVRQMELDDSIITKPASMLKAFTMAADLAGLDDKQACAAANMDPATWSRFKQGAVGIKPDSMERFFDCVENELPLHHLAYRRGFYLQPRMSEIERRIAAKDTELAQLRLENKILRSVYSGAQVIQSET